MWILPDSLSLKNLLETLLAVGNYLNGSSQNGQADGFSIHVLNKLKDTKDIVSSLFTNTRYMTDLLTWNC